MMSNPPSQLESVLWPCTTCTGVTEEAMAEGAPARVLARGERTKLPPTLCLARAYEAAHPRPDLDEFIMQYRKAGGRIDVTIFEEEGAGVLRESFHGCCTAGPRTDDSVHPAEPRVIRSAQITVANSEGGPTQAAEFAVALQGDGNPARHRRPERGAEHGHIATGSGYPRLSSQGGRRGTGLGQSSPHGHKVWLAQQTGRTGKSAARRGKDQAGQTPVMGRKDSLL